MWIGTRGPNLRTGRRIAIVALKQAELDKCAFLYYTLMLGDLGDVMESSWWVVAAFLAGGSAGMLVFALMSMVAREDERAVKAEQAAIGGVDPATLGAYWG